MQAGGQRFDPARLHAWWGRIPADVGVFFCSLTDEVRTQKVVQIDDTRGLVGPPRRDQARDANTARITESRKRRAYGGCLGALRR